jgi:hypothetical protein
MVWLLPLLLPSSCLLSAHKCWLAGSCKYQPQQKCGQ